MGATLCVNEMLHRIAILKANTFKVVGMVLNIGNAYNCANSKEMIEILNGVGLDAVFVNWIRNFLGCRILRMGGYTFEVRGGLPQGSLN